MVKRLRRQDCAGIIVDVQEFFLKSLPTAERIRLEKNLLEFLTLLEYLRIPSIATLERPIEIKGSLPRFLLDSSSNPIVLEKDFFDLSRHTEICSVLADQKRNQLILVGCETDVCILQSCLGLLDRGYQVFVVEDLVFTPANPATAFDRIKQAGAVTLSLKTLFHELVEAAEGTAPRLKLTQSLGPLPERLKDI